MIWGITMKKLRLEYTPAIAVAISCVLSIIAICFGVALFVNYTQNSRGAAAIFGLAVGTVIAVILYCIESIATVVEYGENKIIKCQWAFYKWQIDLEQAVSFCYYVESHRGGRGPTWYTLNVQFDCNGISGGKSYILKTKIRGDELKKCLKGKTKEIELMQIYKYAERLYPEKADGMSEEFTDF